MSRRPSLVIALIVGLAMIGAGVARADRVVVLDVAGDGSHEIEQVLASIVRDEHEVVSSEDFKKAARRAKVKRRDEAGLATVARKVNASAILDGTLGHADDAVVLTIRVRDRAGKAIDEVTIGLNGPTLSERSRRKLGRQLLVALDKLSPSLDAVPVRPPLDDDAADEEAATSEVKVAPPPARTVTGVAPASGDLDEPEPARAVAAPARVVTATPAEVAVAATARPVPQLAPPLAIRLEAGGSATARSLTFVSRADLQNPPVGYRSSPVPGSHVAAELYPFAFFTRGAAARLGVDAEYDQTFGTTTASGGAMQVAVPVTQALVRAGVRLRVIGATRDSTSVTLTGGYGQRVFLLDRTGGQAAAVADVPDVDYRFFDPGIAIRVPLGETFALSASARGLLIQGVGGIGAPEEYGSAASYGVDAEAGFEIILSRFLLHVSGRLTEVDQQFQGNGAKVSNRDGDPSSPDVAGAQDRYYGGVATLGVLY